MTTRRNFLRTGGASIAGMGFCACGLPRVAAAQGAPPRFVLGGGRVRTIDLHAHCYVQEAIDLMSPGEPAGVLPGVKGAAEHFVVVAERLRDMDAMGIDVEVLSINPFWYRKDRETAEKICRIQNTRMAELCAAAPGRLMAFASLPMQFPDLAATMLEEAMKVPGLRGAAIGGSVAGDDFSNPRFAPVLAAAERTGATLFIHPQGTPELARRFAGNGWLSNTIGNPLDTTIALQHLIFQGTLDRFPHLKIVAAHGGGYVGSYRNRSDMACFVAPPLCDPSIVLRRKPSEYVDQIWFDALVFTSEGLRHLVAEVGASQVVIGTDFPIPWETHPVEHVLATTSLSAADKAAILGGNAAKLLQI